MDIQTITDVFKWYTIVMVIVFFLSAILVILCRGLIYRFHGKMFGLSKETLDIIIYSYLGLFKIVLISTALCPYIALCIVRCSQ
jgi:hypothetical protein